MTLYLITQIVFIKKYIFFLINIQSMEYIKKFELSSDQPKKDNPYSGDIPIFVTMEIGITYKEEGTKIYVTITGGNRTWWSFSYEDKEVKDIETSKYELSKSSIGSIKKIMRKYSKNNNQSKKL